MLTKDKHAIGRLYRQLYGQPAVQDAVAAVSDATRKHGIDGHAAALRWAAFHSVLDGEHGDGVVFGVSKVEQVHKSLDAIEAGPLPNEVVEALSATFATLGGAGPAYHV
ncbi:aldo/keto reductase [Candidatus Bathyarchaeota archaeon]|nr:aldo/keto reductase [Candidatus Bathyarchaeota archaeon]